ncbi:MAG: hypothetical protein ACLVJO_02735 [[Clostridium] scindens]
MVEIPVTTVGRVNDPLVAEGIIRKRQGRCMLYGALPGGSSCRKKR